MSKFPSVLNGIKLITGSLVLRKFCVEFYSFYCGSVTVLYFIKLFDGPSLRRHVFDPRHVHVTLWWTQWYWERIFLEYFTFILSISFDRLCTIIYYSVTDAT